MPQSASVDANASMHSARLLDEAFARVADFDFEIPNPFLNHAPMACEALATLGLASAIDGWLELHTAVLRARFPTFETTTRQAVHLVVPSWGHGFSWRDHLGNYRLLPEWMGYFERAIEDDGWREVVHSWVPRLMPGMASALFHGVIRTSHAVRSLDMTDTGPRRAELARALGNWAVWYYPGQPSAKNVGLSNPEISIAQAAARAAGCYVSEPNIVTLHGVTGTMAVHLLSEHIDPLDAISALSQLEAEHREVYKDVTPAAIGDMDGEWDPKFAERARLSFDPHQVKLVEACLRGLNIVGDPRFIAAARVVTESQ